MSTTQIELDQALLTQAAAILGTTTKKATVNEALRRVVQEDVRRRHIDELAAGALPDLADPDIMAGAWRERATWPPRAFWGADARQRGGPHLCPPATAGSYGPSPSLTLRSSPTPAPGKRTTAFATPR